MAEYVRRRYRTARFTTAVALLGVLTGIGLSRGDDSVLDYEDAATKGNVITIRGNSITSKHIKNGSLLAADFKANELERRWDKIVLKHRYLTEDAFPDQLARHINKVTPLLARTFDDAFVGEGEFDARFDKRFEKWRPSLEQSISDTHVGDSELEGALAGIFAKVESSPRKVTDALYWKQMAAREVHPQPSLGDSSSAFDVSTVPLAAQGEQQLCPKVIDITGFLTVCPAPVAGGTSWSVTLHNTFDTDMFYAYSPAVGDGGSVGKTIPAQGSVTITTPNLALRTIQIAPTSGEDVPVATLTVSGHRLNGGDGDLRVTTQLMVARP